MSDQEGVGLWRGKAIEDLSREELIEAIHALGAMYRGALTRWFEVLEESAL